MILKVAYNNQNWAGTCKNANNYATFFKCIDKTYNVNYRLNNKGNCLATCWESTLCKKYFWRSTIGNFSVRAEGKVFFVYPTFENDLTLWGRSEVDRVEYNTVYFKEFKAMPREKWVRNLSAIDIFGTPWMQPPFRYLIEKQEEYLEDLIRKHVK